MRTPQQRSLSASAGVSLAGSSSTSVATLCWSMHAMMAGLVTGWAGHGRLVEAVPPQLVRAAPVLVAIGGCGWYYVMD